MVVPEPKKNESEKKYIKRCTATLVKLGRPKDHASAVCRTKWEKGDVSTRKLFERIDRIVGEDAESQAIAAVGKLEDKLRAAKKKYQSATNPGAKENARNSIQMISQQLKKAREKRRKLVG